LFGVDFTSGARWTLTSVQIGANDVKKTPKLMPGVIAWSWVYSVSANLLLVFAIVCRDVSGKGIVTDYFCGFSYWTLIQ